MFPWVDIFPHGGLLHVQCRLADGLVQLGIPSVPPTAEMLFVSLVRILCWLASSGATLQVSKSPQRDERARTIVATASAESRTAFLTSGLALIG